MATFIDPTAFSVGRANSFLQYLGNSQRYLFAADHRPSTNTTLPQLSNASSNTFYVPWQQMLFGKEIQYSALGIPNYPYSYGTTFAQWDDQIDPTTQMWYAIVNAGSYSHVFGCLDNANGSPSTVQPDFTTAVASDTLQYRASDGYKWMYLTTTDSSTVANLSTAQFFPLLVNAAVTATAVSGAIDEIALQSGGKGYNNYSDGSFQASDIKVGATPTLYQLSNSSISSANGYYQGCVLLITSGTGVGQFATIHDYFVTAQGNFANISSPFSITPTNGSGWEVMPGVEVVSDGTQTQQVVARGLVNAVAANSIWRVEVLNRGAGYLGQIFTTEVVANAVVGVTTSANVRAILSPRGGHGYDVANELGATAVLIGTTFSNTEGGLIPSTNQYKQVGLLNNPLFANVNLTLANSYIPFANGETIDVMSLTWAANAVVTNSSSVVVGCDTRMFQANSEVFIQQGAVQFLTQVASVTNSSSMNLVSNSVFTGNASTIYLANVQTKGFVNNPSLTTSIFVSNVSSKLTTGQTVYGETSGAAGVVTTIKRNSIAKSEQTFVQLSSLAITVLGGTFVQNETVLQGNSTALVHSYSNGNLYISNLTAPFVQGGTNLVGNTSGAVAQVTSVYGPELVQGSGQIEYLENLAPITRTVQESESFIIAYQF